MYFRKMKPIIKSKEDIFCPQQRTYIAEQSNFTVQTLTLTLFFLIYLFVQYVISFVLLLNNKILEEHL
jgi:hypothetical protein